MSSSMIYVVDLTNKSEHIIQSKYFSKHYFCQIMALNKGCGQMGSHAIYRIKLCLHAKFRSVIPFSFFDKRNIFGFFGMQK